MSDEIFSTTLAYTKSPKATKRTSFQDELIRAITARSARQRSSEYSDDFDSDEIVSLGEFSDTSTDESLVRKKVNDFHISDDEEKSSPRLSFLKTKKVNSDVAKDGQESVTQISEDMSPDVHDDPKSQNDDQEVGKEITEIKAKPRVLPIKKSTSSGENSSSHEADDHFKPSPRPRSIKKSIPMEEGDRPDDKKQSPSEDSATMPSLPRQNGTELETEEKVHSENLDLEDSLLQSLTSSSIKESPANCTSPGSQEKISIKDHDGEPTEIWDSLISNENEENSVLVNCVTPEVELPKTSQVTADDTEEEKEKAGFTDDDFTTDPLLSTSPSVITPTETAEPAKKTNEERNMKNKKPTNNRVSSASGRLMTSEFLKKSGPTRRSPSAATSSHYLGTLKVLDKKPSRKQSIETDKADHIRAAVYQEWLEKKNVYLHEMHRIKRIESENLRIQNEQKRAAKREEALASFEAWKAMKEKEAKKIAAKKRLEEKNKRKTEEENAVRKSEALQAFEKWKEKKLEYLKEKTRKEKEYERAKKQKEEETVAEKKKDNLTAFEKWSEKKEALLKQKEKEKINERRKEELKRAEKKDKDQQAISEYEKWLEKKERQERVDRKQKKRHSYLESETHPPWSPPSRTVPSKVL
ncbi:microtubule-associated protein 9 [Cricetulus griseus]|uniref:Microtubule-associated protein 9 n=1 Tax=Cricetulus griseus TaxID=10029 RepID=A0A061IQ91_CRIGR|nr:microtubule-associated protein 9 [Cricetulus griseus]XP_007638409.1 microtubule-associated protein 9 [Cricetulus griseus]XP_027248737.1 microtubule-associated protein 9 [Cricetulus griseus]XP_027248738.1 microtubule-associated protein 9 [Cricetulus griseus]ERE90481.1 microtubule-associated protein 9 [Cricetulus griseus]